MPEVDAAKIAALNDHARQTFQDCRVVVTRGIEAITDVQAILHQVRVFDQFTPSNDPYGEHDFGSFIYADITIFWKFDYFDLDMTMHSLDPSDPSITARVLTVIKATPIIPNAAPTIFVSLFGKLAKQVARLRLYLPWVVPD